MAGRLGVAVVLPNAKIAMNEAHALRRDEDNERECRQRAEQRTQGCLAQTHNRTYSSYPTDRN